MPVIKEYEQLICLGKDEWRDLKDFALANQNDQQGNHRPVLVLKNDRLYAQNTSCNQKGLFHCSVEKRPVVRTKLRGHYRNAKRDADTWLIAIKKN